MERKLTFLVAWTLLAIACLLALLGYWQFYPYKTTEVAPQPYPIVYPIDRIVKQGDYLAYEFRYENFTTIQPTVQRQFVDGIIFNAMADTAPSITKLGKGTVRVQIKIPETLPPGTYFIRILVYHQMNPIRELYHEYMTESFQVIGAN